MKTLNLTAPLNGMGYGTVGRGLLTGLARAGCEVACWPIGRAQVEPHELALVQAAVSRQAGYDPSAPSVRVWHQFDLAQHVGKGPHCAMPIFELDRFRPNELHHLRSQDKALANSHWAATVLADNGVPEENIDYVPLGADPAVFAPCPLPDGGATVFLNVGKWELRKGHDLLVEAFNAAFGPDDDVELWMACDNECFADPQRGQAYNRQWQELYLHSSAGQRGQVKFLSRLSSQLELAGVMARAHCGVFPSRGEGWGLPAGEMLAMGRHVIATDCAGHTEFLDEHNARLITPGPPEDAHDGVWFRADDPAWNGRPGRWASLGRCQKDQLVEHLRAVHRERRQGRLGLNDAGVVTMGHFTWENSARELLATL